MLCDPDCKKPKLRLKILTLELAPPSYRNGAKVSRRWDGVFAAKARPLQKDLRLLGKENHLFGIQNSGQFNCSDLGQFI